MKIKEVFLSELAPVRRALECWRATRKHGQRIPQSLWLEMAALARIHGVSPVSQALRLDYYHLKRRAAAAPESRAFRPPDFVELKLASSSGGVGGCVAELEDAAGRKLTLRWTTTPGAELLGLVEAFWNQSA